jgi:hypothetical protein
MKEPTNKGRSFPTRPPTILGDGDTLSWVHRPRHSASIASRERLPRKPSNITLRCSLVGKSDKNTAWFTARRATDDDWDRESHPTHALRLTVHDLAIGWLTRLQHLAALDDSLGGGSTSEFSPSSPLCHTAQLTDSPESPPPTRSACTLSWLYPSDYGGSAAWLEQRGRWQTGTGSTCRRPSIGRVLAGGGRVVIRGCARDWRGPFGMWYSSCGGEGE